MIAGAGIPMDAVVSDFLSGAAEMLSPDAAPDHWDVIEGQGSLFTRMPLSHWGYCMAVSPMRWCAMVGRTVIDEYADYPVLTCATVSHSMRKPLG